MIRALIFVLTGFYAAVGFMFFTGVLYTNTTGNTYSLDTNLMVAVGIGGAVAGYLLRR